MTGGSYFASFTLGSVTHHRHAYGLAAVRQKAKFLAAHHGVPVRVSTGLAPQVTIAVFEPTDAAA